MITSDHIFGINSEADFDKLALEIFRFQAQHCATYREYLSLIGVDSLTINNIDDIPFLPVELFKSHKVYCAEAEPQKIFTSSSTTGLGVASHYVADLSIYERSFTEAFELFYGRAEQVAIYALLPGYLQREGSSLVYMVDKLVGLSNGGDGFRSDGCEEGRVGGLGGGLGVRLGSGGCRGDSGSIGGGGIGGCDSGGGGSRGSIGGFYLDNYEALLRDMAALADTGMGLCGGAGSGSVGDQGGKQGRKKILLGVSYALWDLAERYPVESSQMAKEAFTGAIIMETGGMKGNREELPKREFHKILQRAFGVESVHSEYGMAEMMSQAYSSGEGLFVSPPWMRVCCRDIHDPFCRLPFGARGGVNVIDLANLYSCSFIQTQDVGVAINNESFRIEGRISGSDIRGCNMLINK